MNWYYAQGGNQLGPVTQEEFDRLVAAGTITGTTLVWHDGLNNWQPWETLQPPVASASAAEVLPAPPVAGSGPAAPGRVRCRECGGDFAEEDTIRFGDARVCAACKPVFLQRLAEGAALSAGSRVQVGLDEVLRRDYQINYGRCLERAWATFKESPGLLIGGGIIAYVLIMAVGMVFSMLQLVSLVVSPVVSQVLSTLVSPFVQGPLMGGLYLLYFSKIRGKPADIGMIFKGFGSSWVHLSLAMLVQTVVMSVAMLPFMLAIGGFAYVAGGGQGGGTPASTLMGMGAVGIITLGIGFVIFVYCWVSWMFSLALVMDKKMKFWPALEISRKVVAKHFWQCVLLMLLMGLIISAGFFACVIGALVSLPVAFAMWCWAYEDLFGDMVSQ